MEERDTQDTLYEKALDAISSLLSRYEAGLIGPEGFKIGVETVWDCLGGVVLKEEFQALIQSANEELRGIPSPTLTTVMSKGESAVVLMRTGANVCALTAPSTRSSAFGFEFDEEAVAHVRKYTTALADKGFKQLGVTND